MPTRRHEKAAPLRPARTKPSRKAAALWPFSRRFTDGPVVTTRPFTGVLVLERGKEAHFECSAAGNPTPTMFWRKQVSLAAGQQASFILEGICLLRNGVNRSFVSITRGVHSTLAMRRQWSQCQALTERTRHDVVRCCGNGTAP